jgi:hypothetical protein
MIDDMFVIDAVVHAYNQTPENFADPAGAGAISESSRSRVALVRGANSGAKARRRPQS